MAGAYRIVKWLVGSMLHAKTRYAPALGIKQIGMRSHVAFMLAHSQRDRTRILEVQSPQGVTGVHRRTSKSILNAQRSEIRGQSGTTRETSNNPQRR